VFDTCSLESVNVRLTRQSDGRVWNFGSSRSGGYFTVAPNNVAYDECIIFRPEGVSSYNSGEIWRVEVSGLSRKDGRAGNISYTVQFTGNSGTNGGGDQPVPDNANNNNTTRQEIHHYYHEDKREPWDCNFGWGAVSMSVLVLGIPRWKSRAGR
jgi:hypothetical protein